MAQMMRFVLKNVFRKKFVAILSSLGIGFGLMLMFVLGAFNAGVDAALNENFSKVLGVVEITEAEQQGSNSQLPPEIIDTIFQSEIGDEILAYNVFAELPALYSRYYSENDLLKNENDMIRFAGLNRSIDQEWDGKTTQIREGGRIFSEGSYEALMDARIVDDADNFGLNVNIGDTISIYLDYPLNESNVVNLTIVGIFEQEDNGAPDFVPRDYYFYMDLAVCWEIRELGWSEAYDYFDYYTRIDLRFPAEETEIINSYINDLKETELGVNIDAYSLAAFQEELAENLSIFDSFSIVISAITAIAGGMAIIVAQLNSVSQRIKEFAILKSTGWKNKHIFRTVVYESLSLGILGAIIGLLLGWGLIGLFSQGFGPFGSLQSKVTSNLIITILSFALGIGLIGGIYPGIKASRVRPVQALKGE